MKTVNKITQLVCILAFLIISNSSKAQCPTISNNLGCQVDGTIDIYTYATPPSGPCNSSVCNSYVLSIPANGFLNINCSGCLPVCNVVLNITALDGTPFAVNLDFSNTTAFTVGSSPTACNGTGLTNYVYDPSSNTFKLYR